MRISGWRRIEDKDLATCFELQPAAFGAGYANREDILHGWKTLLASAAFDGVVVEADHPAARHGIIGFGAGAFVASDFVEEELRDPRPYLSARVVASLASRRGLVLSRRQLSINNSSSGLDMVILATRWAPALKAEEARAVQVQLETAFLKLFVGFNFRRLLAELTDDELLQYVRKTGFWRIVKQFRSSRNPGASGDDAVRALVMLDRQMGLSAAMSAAVPLFQVATPLLGLRSTDKELLVAALKGATDRELADDLNLTKEAVKRRWKVLFDRLEAVKPEIFGASVSNNGKRGPQKRHRILAYVRDHPEELRPFKF